MHNGISLVYKTDMQVYTFRPDLDQMETPKWEVEDRAEPIPEELVDFKDAFDAAMEGAEISPETAPDWFTYCRVQNNEHVYATLLHPSGSEWFPSDELRKGKWRIREKQEEEKEIFVYCACNSDGKSYAFQCDPQNLADDGSFIWDNGDSPIHFDRNNLFPKDKPQKCKLVPVEDK
jgi:hypothetical protein